MFIRKVELNEFKKLLDSIVLESPSIKSWWKLLAPFARSDGRKAIFDYGEHHFACSLSIMDQLTNSMYVKMLSGHGEYRIMVSGGIPEFRDLVESVLAEVKTKDLFRIEYCGTTMVGGYDYTFYDEDPFFDSEGKIIDPFQLCEPIIPFEL